MEGKIIAEGICEPDELMGMNINWAGYTPPGGFEWQKMFYSCGRPGIQDAIKTCMERQNEISSIGIELSAIRKGMESVGKVMDMLDSNIGKRIMDVVSVEDGDISDWRNKTKLLSEVIGEAARSFTISDDEKRAVEIDTAFLKSLESFFTNDLHIDLLLFGIYKVDAKFRTKIFRSIMKTLKECEDAMNVIDTSKSVLKSVIMKDHYEKPYQELSSGYGKLGSYLRKAKKRIDKVGPSFWDSNDRVEFLVQAYESDKSIRAMTQWSWASGSEL